MDFLNQNWSVPAWIASRSYFTGTEKARTIITNSKWGEYLVLEDLSSDMWEILPEHFTLETLKEPLATIGIDLDDSEHRAEVENFLESLRQSEGLVLDGVENLQKPATDNSIRQEIRQIPQIKAAFDEQLSNDGILASLNIELTYRCCEKCVHCFNPKGHNTSSNELTTAQWKILLNEAAEMGVSSVSFTGSEIFLRDDIFEILDETKRLNFSFSIATNGQLLTDDKTRRLAKLYPSNVGISIYSANPDIHDATTGVKGSFEKSVQALKLLQSLGVITHVKNPLMQHTVHGYEKLLELCNELHTTPLFDCTISPSIDGNQYVTLHQITDKEILEQVFREKRMPLYVGLEKDGQGKRMNPVDDTLCGAGSTALSICPDGTVYPCNSLPIELGKLFSSDIKDAGLQDIWKHSEALKVWNRLTAQDTNECGLYAKCSYCNYCAGLAMLKHNDLLRSHEESCSMAEVRHGVAIKLAKGIDPAVEYNQKNGKPFGYSLTFVAPVMSGNTPLGHPEINLNTVSIDHSGEHFIEKVKQIKQHGNLARKSKQCEPDSPQDLYNRGELRKENAEPGRFTETGR